MEFSISSSIMVMLIALVWGVFDVLGLIMIMSVNAGMCWFGDMFETINVGRSKKDIDWTAFNYAAYAACYFWAVFLWFISQATYLDSGMLSTVPQFCQLIVYVWLCLSAFLTFDL